MKKEICRMCKILKEELDWVLYEDEWCKIVPTKNMKGHKKRIMIISKDHNVKEGSSLSRFLIETLVRFSKEYFNEPTFALVDSTYASYPEHWHRIACDWNGTAEVGGRSPKPEGSTASFSRCSGQCRCRVPCRPG